MQFFESEIKMNIYTTTIYYLLNLTLIRQSWTITVDKILFVKSAHALFYTIILGQIFIDILTDVCQTLIAREMSISRQSDPNRICDGQQRITSSRTRNLLTTILNLNNDSHVRQPEKYGYEGCKFNSTKSLDFLRYIHNNISS